jgi:hypothetical protein
MYNTTSTTLKFPDRCACCGAYNPTAVYPFNYTSESGSHKLSVDIPVCQSCARLREVYWNQYAELAATHEKDRKRRKWLSFGLKVAVALPFFAILIFVLAVPWPVSLVICLLVFFLILKFIPNSATSYWIGMTNAEDRGEAWPYRPYQMFSYHRKSTKGYKERLESSLQAYQSKVPSVKVTSVTPSLDGYLEFSDAAYQRDFARLNSPFWRQGAL